MHSQVQVMCRCGGGSNPLKDVKGRTPISLCHGQIRPNLAMTSRWLFIYNETKIFVSIITSWRCIWW